MPTNESGEFLWVTPVGGVYCGSAPPPGSTVLVAPGGELSDDLAGRYGVEALLAAPRSKAKPAAQGKAVRLDKEDSVEDKAVSGPGVQAARKAPAKPAAKGK